MFDSEKKQYIIVDSLKPYNTPTYPFGLDVLVNQKIEQGYAPIGGVTVDKEYHYLQAMVYVGQPAEKKSK